MFLDASKAFDRVNHWLLFKKRIDRKVPLFIVRLLCFWYTNQKMNVKWGAAISNTFSVHNGVKQGGILSPLLFCVYMDDLAVKLNNSGIGCHYGGRTLNHFSYADDMSLVAPSPGGLRKLIAICEQYARDHDIIYNSEKSVCMLIHSKKVKFSKLPVITLLDKQMKYVDSYKYLGCFISADLSDDLDVDRQRRVICMNANRLSRQFHKCSEEVKIKLFRTYCSNMYCSQLWCNYRNSVMQKLKVTYHNAMRWLCNLPSNCSASNMLVSRDLPSFEALRRKYIYGFVLRLDACNNSIIKNLSTVHWYFTGGLGPEVVRTLYTVTGT